MCLDPAWAVVAGAAVGVFGTLGTTCLAHHLQTRKGNSLADKRRKRLIRLLEDERWTWRTIDRLASAAGADHDTTIELLLEIDARADMKNPTQWALESRAPWPDNKKQD